MPVVPVGAAMAEGAAQQDADETKPADPAAAKAPAAKPAASSAAAPSGALVALLASARSLSGAVSAKSAEGADAVGVLGEGFFDDSQDQDDLVDQVRSRRRNLILRASTLRAECPPARASRSVTPPVPRGRSNPPAGSTPAGAELQGRDLAAALRRKRGLEIANGGVRAPPTTEHNVYLNNHIDNHGIML